MQSIEFFAVRQLFRNHDFADLLLDGHGFNNDPAPTGSEVDKKPFEFELTKLLRHPALWITRREYPSQKFTAAAAIKIETEDITFSMLMLRVWGAGNGVHPSSGGLFADASK